MAFYATSSTGAGVARGAGSARGAGIARGYASRKKRDKLETVEAGHAPAPSAGSVGSTTAMGTSGTAFSSGNVTVLICVAALHVLSALCPRCDVSIVVPHKRTWTG